MNVHEAAEHLQVIRTLMERSTIYRRALQPIMVFLGCLGVAGAVLGCLLPVGTGRAFVVFWSGIGLAGIVGSYRMGRRQAFLAGEAFWSPPTRRVTQALLPPMVAGAGSVLLFLVARSEFMVGWLVPLWMGLYGCALHSAGFSMPRGIQGLGWCFLAVGGGLSLMLALAEQPISLRVIHVWMALGFGGLHWGYALCLRLNESGESGDPTP